MPFLQTDLVEVKRIRSKGRGVFARRAIASGTVIERVPVVVVPTTDVLSLPYESRLADYVFDWGRDTVALALGYGSLYNHSYAPNARYDDEGQLTKVFTAITDIAAGDEVTVNYNGDPHDGTDVGFPVLV